MTEIFKKAKQNRVFQDVVDQIQAVILDGKIEVGAKLPPERELCESFQVSRGSLREALRILEQKSLIEMRLGVNGGAYVKDANAELMAENLAMLIRSQSISLEHLAEFREDVESNVAGFAAQRATGLDNEKLQALIVEAEEHRNKGLEGWTKFIQVDERVHMEIARISGNPLYTFVLTSVHDNMHRYYDRYLPAGVEEMEENFQDLKMLVEAITNKDAPHAREVAREHVHRFNAHMVKRKRVRM